MKINKTNIIFDDLTKYCYCAKKDDYIEITEWSNGEGFDIKFNDKSISLTHGELSAINYIILSFDYNDEVRNNRNN